MGLIYIFHYFKQLDYSILSWKNTTIWLYYYKINIRFNIQCRSVATRLKYSNIFFIMFFWVKKVRGQITTSLTPLKINKNQSLSVKVENREANQLTHSATCCCKHILHPKLLVYKLQRCRQRFSVVKTENTLWLTVPPWVRFYYD